ncbi:MAG: endonuclease III [Clostridioides sp.]|jgi:endonuclease-3|nr:endonuclease III [Clostridioides sp.]
MKSYKKNKKNISIILNSLEQMHPDAKCELNYTTPFELLIATILSAQCTDVRVNKVTEELFKKYNTAEDFASLDIEEIEENIKTCGLYRSKAKKIKETSEKIFSEYKGKVPDNIEQLIKLPGVGRKTADVVLSNAFGKPAIAVDTHVFRVTNRIGLVNEKTPEKTEFALMDIIPKNRWSKMHHVFIFQGRYICKAQRPLCDKCEIKPYCDFYCEEIFSNEKTKKR